LGVLRSQSAIVAHTPLRHGNRAGVAAFDFPPRGWGPGAGYILCNRFGEQWEQLRRAIEGDIQRIRAHATANYDEQTKQRLAVRLADAEWPMQQAEVLAELMESLLVALEDTLGNAQDDVREAEAEMKKGRSRKGSKRTQ